MIEFTISRAVLCICGIALMGVILGYAEIAEEKQGQEMCENLAWSFANILDRFEHSSVEKQLLFGSELLPDDSFYVAVSDHIITVSRNNHESHHVTEYPGKFNMTVRDTVELVRSLSKNLGDVPDSIGEDVNLLESVIEIYRSASTSVDSA